MPDTDWEVWMPIVRPDTDWEVWIGVEAKTAVPLVNYSTAPSLFWQKQFSATAVVNVSYMYTGPYPHHRMPFVFFVLICDAWEICLMLWNKGASLLLLILLCACQWPSILPLSGNQFQIFFPYCKVEGTISHVFCHLVWSRSTIIYLFLYFATKFSLNLIRFFL